MNPSLAGVVLRKPNTYSASREQVRADVTLAGGGLRRYVRGSRRTFRLTWRNLRRSDADAIRALGLLRGPLPFTTPDGENVWVLIDNAPEPTPVPGTADRFNVELDLAERGVR